MLCPTPAAGGANIRAVKLVCQCPVRVPRGTPLPLSLAVQVGIKRGNPYQPVDAPWLDVEDHEVTLPPNREAPLVLVTAMIAKANYDTPGVVIGPFPSAFGAQALRDRVCKGLTVGLKSYRHVVIQGYSQHRILAQLVCAITQQRRDN